MLLDLKKYNEGTTVPSLRTETLNKLKFDIPKLEQQKKILSVLEPIDKKIKSLNKINDNLAAYFIFLLIILILYIIYLNNYFNSFSGRFIIID